MLSDTEASPGPPSPAWGLARKMRQWADYSLGFDLRSLALLRIAAPSVYLCELLLHWKYIEAYYTDNGLLPRPGIFEGSSWSIYLAFGSLDGAHFLYVCQILALLCLILGWRTRWASLACYVFTTSLQNRFPALPGWEAEIRLLFLIGCFLPWGTWASLDARGESTPRPVFVVSAATVAWRLQVVILYLASGLLKGGPGWQDGTAVEVSLASDAYATSFGLWVLAHLKHHPQSLVVLNYAVPLLEIFAPLFLLSPWPRIQMLWVVVLWLLHAGFGLCLSIGMFSPICCACLIGFLPSSFLDRWWPSKESSRVAPLRIWESAFLTWVSLSMAISAVENLPEYKDVVRPQVHRPWKALGLEQFWGMFVPPPFEGGWHVIKGKTLKGNWVNLLQQTAEASEERPELISSTYPGVRGYLFLASYLRQPNPEHQYIQESVADYYRRRWEAGHPGAQDRLSEVEILFFKRQYVPGQGYTEAQRILIHSHTY